MTSSSPQVQTAPVQLLVHTPTWTIWVGPTFQSLPASAPRLTSTGQING